MSTRGDSDSDGVLSRTRWSTLQYGRGVPGRRPPYRADASSNELRGSTHPVIPFARMRRQEPRDSPNSTRELGPTEATIREFRLAPARTTTQCRETERTHRADRRDGEDAVGTDFGDDAPRGLEATEPATGAVGAGSAGGAVGSTDATERLSVGGAMTGAFVGVGAGSFGVTSVATLAGVPPSRGTLSGTAIGIGDGALSVVTATVRAVVLSAFSGAEADGGGASDPVRAVSGGAPFRRIQTTPIAAARAAPTPRQIFGPIGGRWGFVPHHRHSPTLSG